MIKKKIVYFILLSLLVVNVSQLGSFDHGIPFVTSLTTTHGGGML